MAFKLSLIVLSALVPVLVGGGSTKLNRKNDLDIADIVRTQVDPPMSVEDPPMVKPNLRALNGDDGGSNWDRGTYSVAHHSGNLKLYVPPATRVGDTLFLFLR